MYVEENGCYDPNTMQEDGLGVPEDGFSQSMNPNFSMEELSAYHHHHHQQEEEEENGGATKAEMEMQQQMGLDMNHMMQEGIHDPNHGGLGLAYDQSNWENQEFQQHLEMQNGHHHHHHHHQQQNFNNPSLQEPPYPPTPDLLNLLHLPRCSLPNSTLSFMNPNGNFQSSLGGYMGEIPTMESVAATSSVMYDPLFHLNLPPQPPVFRDLFQSLPHGYSLPGSRTGSLFSGVDEREVSTGGGVYQDGEGTRNFDNGIFEFNREIKCIPKGKNGKGGTKQFATERERRENLNDKYRALRDLVPSPTKQDRASVVGDAIGYIEELKRTVNELTLLVEKKRCARERSKRQRTEDSGVATGEAESCNIKAEPDQSYNGSSALRSSWLQRKSKGTEVDVRIIDDEVTIKLAQRKKINCLLIVSRLLDEFQLEIHHVAGGLVGDNYSFLFNSKICEGSSVYASAIASKLIEVVDRQYAVTPPTNSY